MTWIVLAAAAAFYVAGHVCLCVASRRLKRACETHREAMAHLHVAKMHRRWAAEDLKRAVELIG